MQSRHKIKQDIVLPSASLFDFQIPLSNTSVFFGIIRYWKPQQQNQQQRSHYALFYTSINLFAFILHRPKMALFCLHSSKQPGTSQIWLLWVFACLDDPWSTQLSRRSSHYPFSASIFKSVSRGDKCCKKCCKEWGSYSFSGRPVPGRRSSRRTAVYENAAVVITAPMQFYNLMLNQIFSARSVLWHSCLCYFQDH